MSKGKSVIFEIYCLYLDCRLDGMDILPKRAFERITAGRSMPILDEFDQFLLKSDYEVTNMRADVWDTDTVGYINGLAD